MTRALGEMLISTQKGQTKLVDVDKVSRGRFMTVESSWLCGPVREFIEGALRESRERLVLDPFAGAGDLLEQCVSAFACQAIGYDIEPGGFGAGRNWRQNDSLLEIPNPRRAVIVTNPPYLASHSAARKGLAPLTKRYFEASRFRNLYQIALERALASSNWVVAIIPESFLLAGELQNRLERAVVIEAKAFGDTEAPVLVACFGPAESKAVKVYRGEDFLGSLDELLGLREPRGLFELARQIGLEPQGGAASKLKVMFNVAAGRIGLRAVDGTDGITRIAFMEAGELDYPNERILVSSRLLTFLEVEDRADADIPLLIEHANRLLGAVREASSDAVLAPFKGNDKTGRRRRRLDYQLARRILQTADLGLRHG